jgi:HTH-type transcriptional regulator / antitoxin HigA
MNRVIRSDADYQAALTELELLMDSQPAPGTPDGDRLELLTLLLRDFEANRIEERALDPIEAIKFRMEQARLAPRDLIPFVGSRSKVSEVLGKKRPLTLSMIKALHSGLGIPAKALLGDQGTPGLDEDFPDWRRFPLREMIRRGWVAEKVHDLNRRGEELVRSFFDTLGSDRQALVLYRRTAHVRSGRQMDEYAVVAWTARIIVLATENSPSTDYISGSINISLMQELARLSSFESGPRLAREFLGNCGISLVIEPALARTYLDGAAILIRKNKPVIGLTLRHDRMDNFWFCLMHELAHIALHLDEDCPQFFDDLDVDVSNDPREREADRLAGEALIPEAEWRKSPASRLRSPEAVQHLASELRIHPAIIAGRIRHQFKSFRVLSQFVGHGEVRCLFPEINWESGANSV